MRKYIVHSVSLHIFFFLFVMWYGSVVNRTVILTKPTISVSLMKEPKPQVVIEEPVVEKAVTPEPEPEKVIEPAIVPEPIPEVPIKREVEKQEPESKPVEVKEIEEEIEEVIPREEEIPEYGASIDFPEQTGLASGQLAVYLGLIESRISRKWNPTQLGFRDSKTHSCTVHFFISRDGTINRETMVKSSGIPLFDRGALKAVKSVRKFPPMPGDYSGQELGVTFVFTMRSSI